MTMIESEFGGSAASGKVKRKANATRKIGSSRAKPSRSSASSAVSGSPEVMVKVSGYGKGAGHVQAHLNYTSRHGEVELETDRGEILSGKEAVNSLVKDWKSDFGDRVGRPNTRDTMHAVFSMPEGTPSNAVRDAVRAFAKKEFGKNHEFVFALHCAENDERTKQPHCHLTVKCRGIDGTRLSTGPNDVQRWREGFAAELRTRGVDCEATSRSIRGVVKKPERAVLLNMQAGTHGRAPRMPEVLQAARAEATADLQAGAGGQASTQRPWEAAIAHKQAQIRSGLVSAAARWENLAQVRTEFANRKEVINERPNYSGAPALELSSASRLHQSRAASDRGQVPTEALAGLRNLSAIAMVHDKRGLEVLLHKDARSGLRPGQRRSDADSGMRRPGDRSTGPAGRGERLTQPVATPEADRLLAGRVRALVAHMPTIATRHQAIKAQLTATQAQKAAVERADPPASVPPTRPAPSADHER